MEEFYVILRINATTKVDALRAICKGFRIELFSVIVNRPFGLNNNECLHDESLYPQLSTEEQLCSLFERWIVELSIATCVTLVTNRISSIILSSNTYGRTKHVGLASTTSKLDIVAIVN